MRRRLACSHLSSPLGGFARWRPAAWAGRTWARRGVLAGLHYAHLATHDSSRPADAQICRRAPLTRHLSLSLSLGQLGHCAQVRRLVARRAQIDSSAVARKWANMAPGARARRWPQVAKLPGRADDRQRCAPQEGDKRQPPGSGRGHGDICQQFKFYSPSIALLRLVTVEEPLCSHRAGRHNESSTRNATSATRICDLQI